MNINKSMSLPSDGPGMLFGSKMNAAMTTQSTLATDIFSRKFLIRRFFY
jgi:hypothetical protein